MSYFCYQGNDNDCGFASLKMLLANLSKDQNYLYLKKGKDKKDSYSFYDLIKIAAEHNLKLEAYQVDYVAFKDLKAPFLAKLNQNHLVMVKAIKKKSVVVFDPSIGKRKIRTNEFIKMFDGHVIVPINRTNIFNCRDKEECIMPMYRNLLQYAFASFIGTFLMLGFYYLNDDSNFILVIIFLTVIAISELVENWYLIKNIKYFDNKYLPKFFYDKNNRDKEHYNDYINFKKTYFGSNKSLIVSLLFILILSTLFILNDYKNLIVVVIILMIRLIDVAFLGKKDDSLISDVSNLESSAFDSEMFLILNLQKANEKANSYASRIAARKCLNAFLVAVLAIIMMLINKVNSANYVLFHFGAYYMISNSFGNITSYISNYKRLRMLTARFLDSCNL